jgi:outer membrane protein TolC
VALRESRGRRDVELLVAQRYRELKEARDRLAELETTRTLAEESLRAQQIAFSAGLATSLDVVDAEAALSRVRLGMLKALYDADVALAGLLEAAGETDRLVEYVESGTESTTEKVGA